MIHTAMNEFGKAHQDYTAAPMSVCSAMSQGYVGYDIQNSLKSELLSRGISKPVSTVLTQVTVDPYDDEYSTEMIFMHRLDLNSVVNVTEIQCVVVTDTMEESEILNILKSDGVKGVSGRFISRLNMDFNAFKDICVGK